MVGQHRGHRACHGLGPRSNEARLEHRRPVHMCAQRRRGLLNGVGKLLRHHRRDGCLQLRERHGPISDLAEVREELMKLLSNLRTRGVEGGGQHTELETSQAALDIGLVDATGRPGLRTTRADLSRLMGANLRRAVARVACVVGETGRGEQRWVRSALVDDLNGEAEGQEDPGNEHREQACAHIPPRTGLALAAERLVNVAAALGDAAVGAGTFGLALAIGVAQLLDDVDLATRQLLRRRNEPEGVLEGGGQLPLLRPPRGARCLSGQRRLVRRRAQADQQDRVDDVGDVRAVHEHEAEGLGPRGVPALVLDGGGEVGEPRRERPDADGPGLPRVRDDVERQDQVLQDAHHQGDAGGGEERARLREVVAQLVVDPVVEQVHERQEEAQARVDVVRPPVVLHLAVELEVLRRLAMGTERHLRGVVEGLPALAGRDLLLLAVPGRHVVAVARAGLRLVLDAHRVRAVLVLVVAAPVATLLSLVSPERDAEGLLEGLLLEAGHEAAGAVEHLHRGDGEAHVARKHVRAGDARAGEGVLRHPQGEAEEEVGARNVQHEEAHEPGRWRRRVETETSGAVQRREDREGHRRDVVERVLARHRQTGQGLDVRFVLARLRAGHADACVVPAIVHLLIEAIVAAVVREEARAHARGGRGPGRGVPGSAQLHRSKCLLLASAKLTKMLASGCVGNRVALSRPA
mmetsp:Transcript_55724/g.143583  ORF Transcript_55724/g.143583 Transcript_55724/m.143583 type:complete len:693 (-) Transcript_55724:8-2086(-)